MFNRHRRNDNLIVIFGFGAAILFIVFAVFFANSVMTDHAGTRRVLAQQGYTQIEPGGYGFMACSEDDFYATNFEARAPNTGAYVSGTVCAGLFKGYTVRFD